MIPNRRERNYLKYDMKCQNPAVFRKTSAFLEAKYSKKQGTDLRSIPCFQIRGLNP